MAVGKRVALKLEQPTNLTLDDVTLANAASAAIATRDLERLSKDAQFMAIDADEAEVVIAAQIRTLNLTLTLSLNLAS